MYIRAFRKSDLPIIKNLSLKLHPQWFDKNALVNIPIDAQIDTCYIAEEGSQITGFLVFSSQEGKARINWLAVSPEHHGRGIGTKLLNRLVEKLKEIGVKEIKVETVIEQHPADGTYDRTIQFYLKHGFKVIEKQVQKIYKEFKFRKGILLKKLE